MSKPLKLRAIVNFGVHNRVKKNADVQDMVDKFDEKVRKYEEEYGAKCKIADDILKDQVMQLIPADLDKTLQDTFLARDEKEEDLDYSQLKQLITDRCKRDLDKKNYVPDDGGDLIDCNRVGDNDDINSLGNAPASKGVGKQGW